MHLLCPRAEILFLFLNSDTLLTYETFLHIAKTQATLGFTSIAVPPTLCHCRKYVQVWIHEGDTSRGPTTKVLKLLWNNLKLWSITSNMTTPALSTSILHINHNGATILEKLDSSKGWYSSGLLAMGCANVVSVAEGIWASLWATRTGRV